MSRVKLRRRLRRNLCSSSLLMKHVSRSRKTKDELRCLHATFVSVVGAHLTIMTVAILFNSTLHL
ncbi:hypothetical protein CC77DRAFT_1015579 [Alternaria alternata]|uniref:Uncharacterized protein n=1 Tax=Alternaria alternata TaxID=5599 RepID=A0A177E4B4_ALTAL|nr:hypothetical protein CC77DRAFT_1015579 [Alternaria alternata]OAG26260.1 hypothetical protein CC77DRAFT_1015579 [Alternaria alternata]